MQLRVYKDCDCRIAAAINLISERWRPYSARSRRYSIYSLLAETIDPAWNDYISSLPNDDILHILGTKVIFSELARKRGFPFADRRLRNLARLVAWIRNRTARKNGLIIKGKKSFSLHDITSECVPSPSRLDYVFNQTISTLRDLALDCRRKLPRKTEVGGLNARRRKALCELCGEPTELAQALDGVELMYNDSTRFSSRFCPKHRPLLHDETWNPAYRRAKRNSELFNRQIDLLEHHTANIDSPVFPQSHDISSPFLWQLGRRQDLTLLETERIRHLARELADCKITARKTNVVMLCEQGHSQSEIARKLGISRQAVSKFMATESFMQLTEIYRRCA